MSVLIITENYHKLPKSPQNLPKTYRKLSNNYSIGFWVLG